MPARIVCDFCGVVQSFTVRNHRRASGSVAQDPVLLKKCDVPDLPEKRIDCAQQRHAKLLVGEIAYKIEGTPSRVNDQSLQIRPRNSHVTSRPVCL